MQKNLSFLQLYKDENDINYPNNKILNIVQLQILDLETNIRYIQKKGATSHIKESLSQIYNIFNQTEPLFRDTKAFFLHETIKKIMNLFGLICFTLMEQINQYSKNNNIGNNIGQGYLTQKINELDHKKEQRKQKQTYYKPSKKNIQIEHSYPKNTINKLGGIYLYNENYTRHTVKNGTRPLNRNQLYQINKQELARQVIDELDTSPFDTPRPDQILDYFNFKFKFGTDDPIITFHEELQSISNFFIQSKNEALQFLNQTQHQNTIISYDQTSFQNAMSLINLQKQDKIRKFTQKIQSFLQSIKQKSQDNMKIFDNKLNQIQKCKQSKPILIYQQKQTQTDFKKQQELRQKLITSTQQYQIMLGLKERELKQIFSKRLELQNQLTIKNRQIDFLKLIRQEKDILIQSLNKKVKFLKKSNISIDKFNLSKQPYENGRNQTKYKQQMINEQIKTPSEQASYEQIRKQKKMAKRRMITGRRGSLNQNKSLFSKRLTQAQLVLKSISRDQQHWNLSQITQNYRQQSNFDDQSQISSSTNNIQLNNNKQKNLNNNRSKNSRKSNRSIQSLADNRQRGSLKIGNIRSGLFVNRNHSNIKSSSPIPLRYSSSIYQSDQQESLKIIQEQINQTTINKQKKKIKQHFRHSETTKKSFFAKERNNSQNIKFQKQLGSNNEKTFAQGIFQQKEEQQQTVRQSIYSKPPNNSLIKSIQKRLTKQISVIKPKNVIKPKQSIKNHTSSIKQLSPLLNTIKKELNKQDLTTNVKQRTILSSNQYNLTILPYQENTTTKIPVNELSNKQIQCKQEKRYSNSKSILSKNNKQNVSSFGKINSSMYRSSQNSTRFSTKITNNSHIQRNRSELKFRSIKNSIYHPNQSHNIIPHSDIATTQKKESIIIPINVFTKIKEQNQNYKQDVKGSANSSFKSSKTDKEDPNQLLEKLKNRQTILEAEEKEVNTLAMNCQTLHQFKNKIIKSHAKQCGNNCIHLQKFVNNYLKLRQNSKPKLCMPISNIHESIEEKEQFPILRKKKH